MRQSSCGNYSAAIILKSGAEMPFPIGVALLEHDSRYLETFRATLACNARSAGRGRTAAFSARIPVSGPRLVDHRRCRNTSDTDCVGTPARQRQAQQISGLFSKRDRDCRHDLVAGAAGRGSTSASTVSQGAIAFGGRFMDHEYPGLRLLVLEARCRWPSRARAAWSTYGRSIPFSADDSRSAG